MEETLTLDDVKNMPEDVPSNIESFDYSSATLMPIGYYISHSRVITPKKSAKGRIYYEVSFTSGLQNPETGENFGLGRYPERMFLFGTQFTRTGRKGSTSDVADYLRSCGINPKGIASVSEALQQSQDMPVMAFVSWTNKTSKLDDGTWEKEILKGRDFNFGTADEPEYRDTVLRDGQTYTARHKVVGYRKVA